MNQTLKNKILMRTLKTNRVDEEGLSRTATSAGESSSDVSPKNGDTQIK